MMKLDCCALCDKNGDVELLLDGDAPKRIDRVGGNPTEPADVPVTSEKGEGKPGPGIPGTSAAYKMPEDPKITNSKKTAK